MNKIKFLSARMCVVFKFLFFLLPFLTFLYWISPEKFGFFRMNLVGLSTPDDFGWTLNLTSKSLGFIISMIPTGIIMFGLYKLKKLFTNYSTGIIFSLENAIIYKKIGQSLFLLAGADILLTPLMSLVLSFQNPIGKRFISIAVDSSEFCYLITGLIIMIISHVMQEAHKLNNEAELII